MASCPNWTTPLPSFLADILNSSLFSQSLTFPTSDPLSLFQLLAIALYNHSLNSYPVICHYLESQWKPLIASIYSYICELKPQDAAWWTELGKLMYQIAKRNVKGHMLEKVESGMPITHNDTAVLDSLASSFSLYIVWIECQVEGVLTHYYHKERRGELGLLVHILEDNNNLRLLHHENFFSKASQPQIPQYLEISHPPKPFSIGTVVSKIAGQEEQENRLEEMAKLREGKLVNAAIELLRVGLRREFPTEANAEFRAFQTAYSEFAEVETHSHTPLALRSLGEVTRYRRSSQKCLPKQHSLKGCASAGQLELVHVCAHQFHRDCIRIFVENVLWSGNLEVRCPLCSRPLPDQFVKEICPALHQQILQLKMTTMEVAFMQASPEASMPYFSADRVICRECHSGNKVLPLKHGCFLCTSCFMNYVLDTGKCPCGAFTSAEDSVQFERTI